MCVCVCGCEGGERVVCVKHFRCGLSTREVTHSLPPSTWKVLQAHLTRWCVLESYCQNIWQRFQTPYFMSPNPPFIRFFFLPLLLSGYFQDGGHVKWEMTGGSVREAIWGVMDGSRRGLPAMFSDLQHAVGVCHYRRSRRGEKNKCRWKTLYLIKQLDDELGCCKYLSCQMYQPPLSLLGDKDKFVECSFSFPLLYYN